MRTELYPKTAAELLAFCEARNNDDTPTLATSTQYYAAINEAIRMWGRRVVVPRLYSLPDGFTAGVYEYAIPSYVTPPFRLEIRSTAYSPFNIQITDNDTNTTWMPLAGYMLEPAGDGTYKLRLGSSPYSEDGRIIYYADNGVMITGSVTVGTTFNSTATSAILTVSSSPEVGDHGVFKVDTEWMSYDGVTRTSASSYTLLNLTRALYGTTAASHNSTTAVAFGCVVDDQRLWVQLADYVTAYVHALNLHKSTSEDASRHEKLMSFYQQKADNFWRMSGYVSQRKGQMQLSSRAIGGYAW